MQTDTRKKLLRILWLIAIPILLSGVVRALAVYIFVTPNDFAPGGVNGAAVLLSYVTGWNTGWFLLMINVPIFFIAFFFLGKTEAIVSTSSMLLTSGLLIAFDYIPWLPQYGGAEGNAVSGLLAAIASGILLGVALAVMLQNVGTAGGTAVLASVVNKKWQFLSISWITSAFDAIVVIASIFVYNKGAAFTAKLDPVLLALVSLFVTSKTSDAILHGFKIAYKFEIITTHPEEVSKEIIEKTMHSVTRMPAEGMYSHTGKDMLVCIIRKRQIAQVRRIIRKYPDTFAYFTPTSEVYGKFLK